MGKFAIVTGASSGIGLEFAKILAEKSYDLLLIARDKKSLEDIATKLSVNYGIAVDVLSLDLSKHNSAEKVWTSVQGKHVDILINNAGFGDLTPIVSADWKKLEAMIELNITALTRLSQLSAIAMKKQNHGKILHVASIASFFPGPGMAVYYATKSYVLSFSEALSEELRDSGVTVTALCPGPTKTNFSTTASAGNSKLFQGNIPTAYDVALYGYRSLMNGKVVAVHGVKNKILALFLPRITPRFMIRKIINSIQKQ